MVTSRKFVPFLSAALAITTGPIWADLVPVSQTRSVDASASASVVGDSDSLSDNASAPDFLPFNAQVNPLAVAISGNDVSIGQGVAIQHSILGLNSVSATGESSAQLTILPISGGAAAGSGQSLFQYEFTLTTARSYSLFGEVDVASIVTGGAGIPLLDNNVIFEDLGNSLVLFDTLTADEAFSISGTLAPGTYRLSAFASVDASEVSDLADARTVTGLSTFDFTLKTQNLPESSPSSAALGWSALGCVAWLIRRRRA